MNTRATALLTAALLALSACGAATAEQHSTAGSTVQSTTSSPATPLSEAIAAALNDSDRSDPPGGLVAPSAAQTALEGARAAYVQGDIFLYIDSSGQLVRRIADDETVLAQNVCALTHVDAAAAYVLIFADGTDTAMETASTGDSGQGTGWDDDQGTGWDEPIEPTGVSAPTNGRELDRPCDWLRISLDGSSTQPLITGVQSVPVISDGYAYSIQSETGGILRSNLNGDAELIYTPEAGCELKLSAGPQGAICAQYDQGLLVGCCAIAADGAVAVHDWAAGAEFHDGYAVSYAQGNDGSGRVGLYLINADGEQLLDEQARADYLCLGDTVYYWHADPEQPYGFCDLTACDTATGQTQPITAAAQLRAHLFCYEDSLYLTNYDSELYALPEDAAEPEYILDLTVDYDFNSDLMPMVTLYGYPDAPGALIYIDEGQGYRFIGEVAPETTAG